MSDKLLTIRQAAEYLNVHWQTVRTLIKNKKIDAIKIGKQVRIKDSTLEAFLHKSAPKKEIYELELRFLPKNIKIIEENLLKLDAKVIYHGHLIDHWFIPNDIKNIEDKNYWFDSGKGFGLRLREQDNGYTGKITTTLEIKRLLVPYKHDTCIEHDIDVSNYLDGKRLLELMNYKEMLAIDKDRKVYKINDYKVAIDDIKGFKTGLEIEIMTDQDSSLIIPKLKDIASKIGLNSNEELVDKSVTYLAMLEFSKF